MAINKESSDFLYNKLDINKVNTNVTKSSMNKNKVKYFV